MLDTVAHARGAPWYRRALAGPLRGPAFAGARSLARLPLLDKHTAAARQEDLVVPGVPGAPASLSAGIVSSATTRDGRPLRVLLSLAELAPDGEPPDGDAVHHEQEARTLQIVSPRHGSRPPGGARTILPATLHRNLVDVTHDLLRGGRFHTLVAPLSTLKWLTVGLERDGVSPATLGVRLVGTTGYPLTRHTRAWLEPAWRASLVDNWSMSELRGHAHPCSACGFAHWLGAPVWWELVDPLAGAPVRPATGALGELVATTLLPHGARMPLLRYRTGDIVEVGPACPAAPAPGARGMRFRGRLSSSLLDTSRKSARPLLLSRDLLEVTEALPDVAFEPHPAERLALVPPSDLGVPKARVHEGRLVVELRYDPARFPARAREVRQVLAATCLGDVEIELLPPGQLDFTREARKL